MRVPSSNVDHPSTLGVVPCVSPCPDLSPWPNPLPLYLPSSTPTPTSLSLITSLTVTVLGLISPMMARKSRLAPLHPPDPSSLSRSVSTTDVHMPCSSDGLELVGKNTLRKSDPLPALNPHTRPGGLHSKSVTQVPSIHSNEALDLRNTIGHTASDRLRSTFRDGASPALHGSSSATLEPLVLHISKLDRPVSPRPTATRPHRPVSPNPVTTTLHDRPVSPNPTANRPHRPVSPNPAATRHHVDTAETQVPGTWSAFDSVAAEGWSSTDPATVTAPAPLRQVLP